MCEQDFFLSVQVRAGQGGCALPEAPSLQLFNLYGVGLPTERSYQYVHYRTQRVRPRLRGARKSDRMRF